MCQLSKQRKKSSAERGAGMVGLVLALLTMGLLAASSYYLSGPGKTVRELKSNNTDFARIQKALALYVARNNCLPYPALGSAATGLSDSDATVANAVVPWKTLGLDESVSRDAGGRRISYHPASTLVSTDCVGSGKFTNQATAPAGNLSVFTSMTGGTTKTSVAAYVLISHGINGLGGWTSGGTRMTVPTPTDEAANAKLAGDASTTYIQGTYNSTSNVYFDDQLVYATVTEICTATGINCSAVTPPTPTTASADCTSGCIIFDRTTLGGYVSGNSFKMGTNEVTINGVEIKGSSELTASKSGDGAGLGVLGGGSNGYPDADLNTTSETITIEFASSKKTFAIALNGFTASSGTAQVNISDTQGNTVKLPATGGTACGATQAIFNNISFTGTPNFQKLVIKPDNANTSFWIAAVNGCSSSTTCDASVTGFTYCTYP